MTHDLLPQNLPHRPPQHQSLEITPELHSVEDLTPSEDFYLPEGVCF